MFFYFVGGSQEKLSCRGEGFAGRNLPPRRLGGPRQIKTTIPARARRAAGGEGAARRGAGRSGGRADARTARARAGPPARARHVQVRVPMKVCTRTSARQ